MFDECVFNAWDAAPGGAVYHLPDRERPHSEKLRTLCGLVWAEYDHGRYREPAAWVWAPRWIGAAVGRCCKRCEARSKK